MKKQVVECTGDPTGRYQGTHTVEVTTKAALSACTVCGAPIANNWTATRDVEAARNAAIVAEFGLRRGMDDDDEEDDIPKDIPQGPRYIMDEDGPIRI